MKNGCSNLFEPLPTLYVPILYLFNMLFIYAVFNEFEVTFSVVVFVCERVFFFGFFGEDLNEARYSIELQAGFVARFWHSPGLWLGITPRASCQHLERNEQKGPLFTNRLNLAVEAGEQATAAKYTSQAACRAFQHATPTILAPSTLFWTLVLAATKTTGWRDSWVRTIIKKWKYASDGRRINQFPEDFHKWGRQEN